MKDFSLDFSFDLEDFSLDLDGDVSPLLLLLLFPLEGAAATVGENVGPSLDAGGAVRGVISGTGLSVGLDVSHIATENTQ